MTHISDHFPQFLIMENANSSHKNLELFKRDYSSFDERSFLSDFTRLDFNYLYEDSDIDWTYNRFLEDITTLADKHVPIIKYPKKEAKLIAKPWITNRIKKMMKVRDRLLKKMKRNKSETNRQFYKKCRNRVATELKKSKLEYYHNYFAKNEKNMRKLWDGINSIIAKKTCSHSIIDKVKDVNGKLLDDPTQMASNFNEYFVNVADSINKAIPRTPNSPLRYLGSANENSLFLSPVTHFEVEDVISNLSSSKSTGPHSVPIKLLKVVKHHISHPLAELVNQSFLKGIFPSKLKIAKVVSVFKKGDPEIMTNYRPISLLPVFSKIFEKLMYKRLYSFVACNKLLFKFQFGFQENHSIDHALISMTETIRKSLDNKKYGCGVFIDLQKAFDTVNHNILLSKLEHYGIRGNALCSFWSYLTDRTQFVSISGKNSCPLGITCGVPQGSVLGPLLFLLYINDLPNVSKHLKFYFFADDTNLYYDSETLDDVIKKVNKGLKHLKRWLDANKLSLNINKTNFIIFHSSASPIPPSICIKIGKKRISRVKYIKFLGVLMDEHLNGKYHVAELSKKLAKTCGILFRVRHLLSKTTLITLYNAFFMSFLQYGIVAWGQTFDSYIEPLFKLQKRAVRAISHQSFLAHTLPIFTDLKLLRIADIFKLRLLSFVYEAINKSAPDCFHDFFSLTSSIHCHNTRQSTRGDLFLTKLNTLQYGLKSIRYLGAKQWNEIPATIRISSSKFLFKKRLKAYRLNAM